MGIQNIYLVITGAVGAQWGRMINRRTQLNSSSIQNEEMHCLSKMCPWCVYCFVYRPHILCLLEMNEADRLQLRDCKVVYIAVLVSRSFW